ncbi:MAG: oligopeptide transport system permease protein [Epulopiscium sp.]|jgi:oligopeptide transport system permease protein|uniref:Binding-protein-dependent transport systems inner membrane component n=2 Tax=Thermoanaerobacter TaxID=1754 RepID=B0KBN0_THEP3|nr:MULTISPECIES: ABC transporter permease [Thermoanaerobacter]MDK2789022.1 oligopeptide transport system permease protein [Candidatus Epulonipiscium sp.]MDK2986813.1 oligopeptide transport system permease protein [Clostridia bacterium]ABY91855.1 binding-protein-dependent transport systems inner membrane component [Thermoanaerobacter sp. X514]ABY91930.1 binding-protein-dependent transport systems inner membrane component [Thermoanaerobacter sp. X514]ABY95325.1 binding-protein-dependent transpor
MARYILNRLVVSLITAWFLVTIVFFLVRLLPGDPFLSEKVTPEIKQNMMEYYGFDKPLHVQYITYISNLLKGDLGYSLRYRNRTVNEVIAQAFPYSADLGIRAVIFATIVGISLGIIAALNRNKPLDYLSMFIAIVGVSVPGFVIGPLLQYIFSIKLKLLPVAQWKGFAYTIMPTFALSLGSIALMARLMRASMLDVVNQDYIKTAKSKGLSPSQIVWRHQIRNAILPVITVLGPVTATLLTGTFVIEQIFAIPGLGKFYILGIQNLDYSMVLGMTVFYGLFLIAANFIVDIIYGFIDPRIRIAGK